MSIEDQANFANFSLADINPVDDAITQDWHTRLAPYEKEYFKQFSSEELERRDAFLLQEKGKDIPRMSNSRLSAENLASDAGHMNTKKGEVDFCRLVLSIHPTGPIAARLLPMLERKEQELTDLNLSQAFRQGLFAQKTAAHVRDDSDFDQSAPMPL